MNKYTLLVLASLVSVNAFGMKESDKIKEAIPRDYNNFCSRWDLDPEEVIACQSLFLAYYCANSRSLGNFDRDVTCGLEFYQNHPDPKDDLWGGIMLRNSWYIARKIVEERYPNSSENEKRFERSLLGRETRKNFENYTSYSSNNTNE